MGTKQAHKLYISGFRVKRGLIENVGTEKIKETTELTCGLTAVS